MTHTPFAERLRAARRRHFWTQRQLADALGTKYQVVQNWEAGRRSPRPSSLQRLCAALEVGYDDLVGDAS